MSPRTLVRTECAESRAMTAIKVLHLPALLRSPSSRRTVS